MATITLPTDTTGDVFARAGLAIMRRAANVQAVIAGSSVVGYHSRTPALSALADLSAQNVSHILDVLTADLPGGVVEGSMVTIGAASYLVGRPPEVTSDYGITRLHLEVA
jgi:hypothetical protein